MKVIKNKIIPFKGFKAITLWPFIFTREDLSEADMRHERIHGEQQEETLVLPYYPLYLVFWLVEIIRCACDRKRGYHPFIKRPVWKRAYRSIPFEQEAYGNQHIKDYLDKRKRYCWFKYFK